MQGGKTVVKRKIIVITETDYARLQRLIESSRRYTQGDAERLDALQQELERATIAKAAEVPHDVVTMNSRVRVKDLDSGHVFTYQIVFPRDADVAKNRISVLAPIGTALLGYGAGSTVESQVPSGRRHLLILDVEYQPEAAGLAA